MTYLDERLFKIRHKILCSGDAMLITSPCNRNYVSNFASSAGFLVITRKNAFLFLDFRYFEMAKNKQEKGLISREIEIILIEKTRKEYLSKIIYDDAVSTLLFEDKTMTCHDYSVLHSEISDQVKLEPAADMIEKARMIKDVHEIEAIKAAQDITDRAFTHILPYINPNVTENDIATELLYFMKKNGADDIAFDTICVSGKKSSLPHGTPENVKISEGFLTMDFGAKFGGYCSDMTRTVCVGKATEEMKRVYNTVLSAQNAAFDVIKGNIFGSYVDKAARDFIYENGYKGCFGHGTGHSLGLDVHESPSFSPTERGNVPVGAVMSVEPGIYIEGKFGVRIEDIVVLTENGYENLTKSKKELIIL